MRGVVFTEFLTMVADTFSEDMVDDIIDDCDLATDGAYSSVGHYDHSEMLALVTALSVRTGESIENLSNAFGRYLFSAFHKTYPEIIDANNDALDFLERIENDIHVEVRKLYPKAELPVFTYKRLGPQHLEMVYQSSRPFGDLCVGLVNGCCQHFPGEYEYSVEDLKPERGAELLFHVKRV